jgi:hypothetical protein
LQNAVERRKEWTKRWRDGERCGRLTADGDKSGLEGNYQRLEREEGKQKRKTREKSPSIPDLFSRVDEPTNRLTISSVNVTI